MKTNPSIVICILIFVFASCSKTREEKAKALIKDQLRKSLHDFKSYEPVEFSQLDTAYTSLADLSAYSTAQEDFDKAKAEAKTNQEYAEIYSGGYTHERFVHYQTLAYRAIDAMQVAYHTMDSITKSFVRKPVGWAMNHSFRAKNLSGNLGIAHYRYYFDQDLKEIVKREDIGEKAKSNND